MGGRRRSWIRPLRVARRIVAFLLVAFFVALAASDRFVFVWPGKERARVWRRIHRVLCDDGMVVAITFDGPAPRDATTGSFVPSPGTASVPGLSGLARRFISGRNGAILTDKAWSNLGTNGFSVALGIRIPEGSPPLQSLLETGGKTSRLGFFIRDGRIVFSVPTEEGCVELDCAPDSRGEFLTVLAVVDASTGTARLYQNGTLRSEKPAVPARLPNSRIAWTSETWEPFQGDIDEIDAWSRTLSDREARHVSQAGFSAVRCRAPTLSFAANFIGRVSRFLPDLVRAGERLLPGNLFSPRQSSRSIPRIDFRMSKTDRRHFARVHVDSARNGERTSQAANFRNCVIRSPGGDVPVRVCLDTVYVGGLDDCSRRLSFVVVGDLDGDGEEDYARLYPPENHHKLHPADILPLNLDESAYVRVAVNGDLLGVYCLETMDRTGGAAVADFTFPQSLLLGSPVPSDNAFFRLPAAERDARIRRVLSRIRSDSLGEWSRREWGQHLREAMSRGENLRPFTEFDALGGNDAPFRLTSDLDLSGDAFAGVASWRATAPDVLDASGHVTPPPGDLPRRADLVPVLADGTEGEPLRFRVMPPAPRLPILMLHVGPVVRRGRRCDLIADYLPAGGGAPIRLTGFGNTGGGIAHRGNTSYYHGYKRPFSLEFDQPHGLLGPSRGDHINLVSGYGDDTRLRNRFAFDLFRSLSSPGAPRYAPRVDWAEVFVNGSYYGVFELCERGNWELFDTDSPPELFKVKKKSNLYRERDTYAFAQSYPDPFVRDAEPSLMNLLDIATDPSPESFRERAEREIDIGCFIDFALLVTFTGNEDGVVNNHFVAREADGERRYFFVPWDYDKTFLKGRRITWLSNRLDSRLTAEVPGYAERKRARWRELRQGPLSDEALDGWLDRYQARLRGYMDFEYELLGRDISYDDACRDLREVMQARRDYLDRWSGREPAQR